MKLYNIKNINKFFEIVDACKGRVDLISDEGDRINLKSKLSQYLSLASIFSDGTIKNLEIVAYEPNDIKSIIDYVSEEQAED